MLTRGLVVVLFFGSTGYAAMLCARPKSDGSLSTGVKVREVCTGAEVRLGLASLVPLEVVNEVSVTTTTTTTLASASTTTTTIARWIDHADGTISDALTGLMWEKLSDDGSIHDKDTRYSWANATAEKIALLNATSFAGHTDWRLPARLELESILDLTIGPPGPAVYAAFNQDCAFACTVLTCSCTFTSDWYWSSTPYAGSPNNAVWGVHSADGEARAIDVDNLFYARAVRGGP